MIEEHLWRDVMTDRQMQCFNLYGALRNGIQTHGKTYKVGSDTNMAPTFLHL